MNGLDGIAGRACESCYSKKIHSFHFLTMKNMNCIFNFNIPIYVICSLSYEILNLRLICNDVKYRSHPSGMCGDLWTWAVHRIFSVYILINDMYCSIAVIQVVRMGTRAHGLCAIVHHIFNDTCIALQHHSHLSGTLGVPCTCSVGCVLTAGRTGRSTEV